MPHSTRIPVTILAGFLGSGKTTLLRRILASDHGFKIAVIVNEFAEVGIDGDLIKGVGNNPMIAMNNGCICCSLLGGLEDTLQRLWDQSERFDYVVIETTGLADPGPIAHTFMVEGIAKSGFALNGVITMVDAKNCAQQQSEGGGYLWAAQVAGAGVVAINKSDLVGEPEIEVVHRRIGELNPLAEIYVTQRSGIDLSYVLARQTSLSIIAPQHAHSWHIDHGHAHCDHENGHCNHDHGSHGERHDTTAPYTSVCLEAQGYLDPQRLNAWLGELFRTTGTKLPRTKGILSVAGRPRVIVQSVYEQTEVTEGEPWATNEVRYSKMVIIGRREAIDATALKMGFLSCLVP